MWVSSLARVALVRGAEAYDKRRKAEFLLNNASSRADYRAAREEVRRMGLDPDAIPHEPPG